MQIQTYIAAADNAGNFRDAGSILTVGAADDEISAEEAESLLDRALAVDVTPKAARGAKAQADGE